MCVPSPPVSRFQYTSVDRLSPPLLPVIPEATS
jgi:hypothetical protein